MLHSFQGSLLLQAWHLDHDLTAALAPIWKVPQPTPVPAPNLKATCMPSKIVIESFHWIRRRNPQMFLFVQQASGRRTLLTLFHNDRFLDERHMRAIMTLFLAPDLHVHWLLQLIRWI